MRVAPAARVLLLSRCMPDDRFSLRESELDLPTYEEQRGILAERSRASWLSAKSRLDPSPRLDIARAFFRDALRALVRH